MKLWYFIFIIITILSCNTSSKCSKEARESFSGEGFFLFTDVEGMSNHQIVFLPSCEVKNIDSLCLLTKNDLGRGIMFLLYDFDDYVISLQNDSKTIAVASGLTNFSDTAKIGVSFGYLKYHDAYNYGKKFDKTETYSEELNFNGKNKIPIKYFRSSSEKIDTIITYPLNK